ncbi:hypothetical protein FBU30_003095 [Linnemannia zychae]|nr:hypothetical protein FBU30_003095 [Linnemannia zychae]
MPHLLIAGGFFYTIAKNKLYVKKREYATPSESIPTKSGQISWEERIAQDEANAAKKGYKVDYRHIHEATASDAKEV